MRRWQPKGRCERGGAPRRERRSGAGAAAGGEGPGEQVSKASRRFPSRRTGERAPRAPPAPPRGHSGAESQLPRLPSLFFSKRRALQFGLVFAAPNQHCKHAKGVFIFLESKITKQHIRREAFNSAGSFLLSGIKAMIIRAGSFQATHRSSGKRAANTARVTSAHGEREILGGGTEDVQGSGGRVSRSRCRTHIPLRRAARGHGGRHSPRRETETHVLCDGSLWEGS